MAIIKCSNCGLSISDQSSKCVHCGQKIIKKIFCPECNEEIEEGLKKCPKCGYKFPKAINKKRIGIIAVAVIIVVSILIAILPSLSNAEKAVKKSIVALDIANEEIITCLLLDNDDGEYYVYFKTNKNEYMTHIVDNIVESKCDKLEAIRSGVTGSKAASEFNWSNALGRDNWININHSVLEKLTN